MLRRGQRLSSAKKGGSRRILYTGKLCFSHPFARLKMAATFLLQHADLRPFVLHNVRLTGRNIGTGSYGSVEEVDIPGAICAAKKIHDIFQDRTQIPEDEIRRASEQFVVECRLMSSIRHPRIVQFLGVCFFPGSRLPALVMEKMHTSLHEVLDPEAEGREEREDSENKPYIPLALKCSILCDVGQGLAFLHSRTPPIIHRDLSARNVLLTACMRAKIADLGVARLIPAQRRAATMTKGPGASIYMPPEARENVSRYDVTIDIFSFGVVATFTLSQDFPDPLPAAYMDEERMVMVGRTELQRRSSYMQKIERQLREEHPLILMIENCLKNIPRQRPLIGRVIEFLSQARGEIQDEEGDMNRLELVQSLREKTQLIQSKDEVVQSLSEQIRSFNEQNQSLGQQVQEKDAEIQQLQRSHQSQQGSLQTREETLSAWEESLQTRERALEGQQGMAHLRRQFQVYRMEE